MGNPTYQPYRPSRQLRKRRSPPTNDTPEKKSVGWAVFLAVVGLCGIVLAAVIYPIWQDNKDTLREKEYFDWDTPEDHMAVDVQTIVVLGGFLVGGPILLVGIVMIAVAVSYNSKLDAIELHMAFAEQGDNKVQPSKQRAFCPYCGQPTQGTPFCAYCGKKT